MFIKGGDMSREEYLAWTDQQFDASKIFSKPEALRGVRILELGTLILGPAAPDYLGEFGAEVIKVELPGAGDTMRSVTPYGIFWKNASLGQLPQNHNKYHLALDVRTSAGSEIFRQLAQRCDVVVENLRAGTMDRWGIGYKQLNEINPRIIYIALNGFGQWGGYSEGRASYDAVAQTVSGLLATTGFPNKLPLKAGVYIGDYSGALMGAISVLSALHYRHRTGSGQYIEFSQGESLMRLLDWSWIYYYLEKYNRPRTGNRDLAICPSDVFVCKDGPVALAAGRDEEFRGLCQAMGKPELADDPRFAEALNRLKDGNAVALLEIIRAWAKDKTVAEVDQLGAQYGFASSPVLNAKDQYESPHFRARAAVFEYEDPILGKMVEVGSPAKLSRTPGRLKWANKPVGLDNEFVLRKYLGLSTDQIEALAEKKIIGKWVENPPGRKPPNDWDGKAGVIMS
jgi:crotonobetainyl-CoA:carnitine CoA-transferase CaiB-like acyl-CoA transferase